MSSTIKQFAPLELIQMVGEKLTSTLANKNDAIFIRSCIVRMAIGPAKNKSTRSVLFCEIVILEKKNR